MRLRRFSLPLLPVSLALAALVCAPAGAQNSEVLLPAQSSAKARKLIGEMIEALGGNTYLNAKDSTCTGKVAEFGHSGALSDYGTFFDYNKFPDKDRTEFSKKRNIIQIYNGDHGWVLDRGGVSDAPASDVADNRREVEIDLDNILRFRLHAPGMIFRYVGPDIVDLKEADWVEITDPQGHDIRIAIATLTHLPIREEVAMRDPKTHLRTEEVNYYSNFHAVNGIVMPFQVTHMRNGLKIYQLFYDRCKFDTGLSDAMFTKESLEQRWAQVGKKSKKKKD